VTVLWDAGFEHIVYQAIDTFSEGEQASRAAFEKAANEVSALVRFDASFQLEECWQDARGGLAQETAPAREQRLRHLLTLGETRDRAALVQAESFQMRDLASEGDLRHALELDEATLQVVRAQLSDRLRLDARFVPVLAEAYRAGRALGSASAVSVPLRAAMDGLAAASLSSAVRLVSALFAAFEDRDAPGEAASLRGSLAREVVSDRALRALLAEASSPDADGAVVSLVRELLTVADGSFVPIVLDLFVRGNAAAFGDAVHSYLTRSAENNEEVLAAAFAEADLDPGLALVRILGRLATPAAREAMLRAAESPHAVLRIEALSHADAGSERLRLELRALIEDPSPEVRSVALRTIRERQIRAAGPYLAMRVKSAGFDKLALEERRQILFSLAALAPARAEELCVEILEDSRLLTLGSHEDSRALAAEQLGHLASSRDSLAALEDACTGRFRYSERVRNSAVSARELAVVRLSLQPAAPRSSSTPLPSDGVADPSDSAAFRRGS
jgi:hypothetical protein